MARCIECTKDSAGRTLETYTPRRATTSRGGPKRLDASRLPPATAHGRASEAALRQSPAAASDSRKDSSRAPRPRPRPRSYALRGEAGPPRVACDPRTHPHHHDED
eukprot:scaffold5278_cov384-Prasinococcus_capsulatus_cf.AAC.1